MFGGTGQIGALVVEHLLARGDRVSALVRSPQKIDAERPGLTVRVGALADTDAVARIVMGSDAVLSALGPSLDRRATGMPVAEGTAVVVDAMRTAGVRRYVGLATPSVTDPRDRPSLRGWLTPRIAGLLLPRAVAEVRAMSETVRGSGLDWTLVRITAPTRGPARGTLRAGYLGRDAMGATVSRADVAAFMVEQIDDLTHLHAAPAVGV